MSPHASSPGGPRAPEREESGEDASASVELAILCPVYMMLIMGLLQIGNAVIARQKLVQAVQIAAWLPGERSADAGALDRTIWVGGRYGGSFTVNPSRNRYMLSTDETFKKAASRSDLIGSPPGDVDDGGKAASQLARSVLEHSDQSGNGHLEKSSAEGSFGEMRFKFALGFDVKTTPKTDVVVLHRTTVEREGYKAGDPGHPIENYVDGKDKTNKRGFPISRPFGHKVDPNGPDTAANQVIDVESVRFLRPVEEDGERMNPPLSTSGGADGIWNPRFRLGGPGDANREWAFYESKYQSYGFR